MNTIYVDIETLPDLRPNAREAARSRVRVPGNFKKPESIEAYIEENTEDEWRRTALDGGYGQVLCVSIAVDDEEPVTSIVTPSEQDDRLIVADALQSLADHPIHLVVGHNVLWDLKFLYHRAMVLSLGDIYWRAVRAGLPHNPQPWSDQVFDTSYEWTQDRSRGIKLDDLCQILDINTPKQDGLDGSTVFDYWVERRLDEIAAYCAADVQATREIHRRIARR